MVATIHPTFAAPSNKDVRIWRYMDLSKFIWMLQKKALYFCRSDMLGDPFEGYYTKNYTTLLNEFVETQLQDPAIAAIPNVRETMKTNFHNMTEFARSLRPQLYVNCWHMNEFESPAMWKLYASHHESICVQSTYKKLADLLPEPCFLGTVKYIDYNKSFIAWGNALNYIVHKRHFFEHERELRAVVWSSMPTASFEVLGDRGLLVPVDINNLLERIFVSPNSKPILQNVVAELAATYNVDAQVLQSQVNAGPDF